MEKIRCHDIYLAAFIWLRGAKYVGKVREGRRVFLIFEHEDGFTSFREAFFAGAPVDAQAYANKIMAVKNLVMED